MLDAKLPNVLGASANEDTRIQDEKLVVSSQVTLDGAILKNRVSTEMGRADDDTRLEDTDNVASNVESINLDKPANSGNRIWRIDRELMDSR